MSNNFDEFLKFIKIRWTKLALITAFFPISNIFFKTIPLPIDPYGVSTASIAIPLTILACIFVIYNSFIKGIDESEQPSNFFILGFISLIIFFLLEHFEYPLRAWLFPMLDSGDDFILMLVTIVPFYILFFVYITKAFMALALIEFKKNNPG